MDEKQHILVVDDEKNIRLTVAQALESQGYALDTAVNGEDALAHLEKRPYDYALMLLDLKMPGMDGMEVLRHVVTHHPDIRVIIVTAHGTVENAVEAVKQGAVDFIQKPFAPGEIRDLVARVLQRSSLQREQAVDYDTHLELAKHDINERRFASATAHIKQAIAADPSRPEAFNLLGVLQEIEGDHLTALKSYRVALDLDPTYTAAQHNLERLGIVNSDQRNIDLG